MEASFSCRSSTYSPITEIGKWTVWMKFILFSCCWFRLNCVVLSLSFLCSFGMASLRWNFQSSCPAARSSMIYIPSEWLFIMGCIEWPGAQPCDSVCCDHLMSPCHSKSSEQQLFFLSKGKKSLYNWLCFVFGWSECTSEAHLRCVWRHLMS